MRKSTVKSIIELIFWIFAWFVAVFLLGWSINNYINATDKLWPALGTLVWLIFSIRCINRITESWEKI